MRDELLAGCKRFVRNINIARSVFSWDNTTTCACCALMITLKKMDIDEKRLSAIHSLLKMKTDLFSNFRSLAKAPMCAVLYTTQDPEQMLQSTINAYNMFKVHFPSSEYLPLSAMIAVRFGRPEDHQLIANRTKTLFDRIKTAHPTIIPSEGCALCSLLALSPRNNDDLINDMNECYQLMKDISFSSDAKRALCHILSLYEDESKNKVEQTISLYNELVTKKHAFGKDMELAVLGALASSGKNIYDLVAEIVEVDDWLSKQPGFGLLSGISAVHRRMYAGILSLEITDYYSKYNRPNIISSLIAEQSVIFAVVSAASAEEDAVNTIDI